MKKLPFWASVLLVSALYALALFAQSLILHTYPIAAPYIPDVAFLMLLFFSVYCGSFSYWAGFLAACLLQPFLLPDVAWGIYPFAYTLITFIAGKLKGKIIVDAFLIPLLYALGGWGLLLFCLWLFSLFPDFPKMLPHPLPLFFHSLITIAAAIPVYHLLKWTRLIDLNERENH